MRISDWSSDVCSSDLRLAVDGKGQIFVAAGVGPATGYRITAAHADGATSLGRCRQLFHRIPRHARSRHAALPQVFAVSADQIMSSKSTTNPLNRFESSLRISSFFFYSIWFRKTPGRQQMGAVEHRPTAP